MRSRSIIHRLFLLVILFTLALCFVEASAQQRRTRRSRRVTNPVSSGTTRTNTGTSAPTQTPATDPTIISTADEQSGGGSATSGAGARTGTRNGSASIEEEHDSMRNRMNRLSRQVTTLTEKLTKMEEQQRTLVDLERLSRAEQRAEALRAQLRDVAMKEADLQARADQLDYDVKPENIERTTSMTGSVHPEEARDARRRQLENERTRVRSQLDLMTQSRTRLESSIITADAEADRIRQRLDETQGAATQAGTNDNSIEGTSNTETPVPTAPPPGVSPSGTPR
jgi:hypothetical protein